MTLRLRLLRLQIRAYDPRPFDPRENGQWLPDVTAVSWTYFSENLPRTYNSARLCCCVRRLTMDVLPKAVVNAVKLASSKFPIGESSPNGGTLLEFPQSEPDNGRIFGVEL